jgi:hypothetical protein
MCCHGGSGSDDALPPGPILQARLCVSATYGDPQTLLGLAQLEDHMAACVRRREPIWRPRLCERPGFHFTSGTGGSQAHENRWMRRGLVPDVNPPEEERGRNKRTSSATISVSCAHDHCGVPTDRDVMFLCDLIVTAARMPSHDLNKAPDLSEQLHVCWQDWCCDNPGFTIVRQCWTYDTMTRHLVAHVIPQPSPHQVARGWRAYHLDEDEDEDEVLQLGFSNSSNLCC